MKEPQNPFLVLIEEHNAAIESVCRSFCGSVREDREDLRQEIVINLWTGWQRQHPFGSGSAWLWRVAVNTTIFNADPLPGDTGEYHVVLSNLMRTIVIFPCDTSYAYIEPTVDITFRTKS